MSILDKQDVMDLLTAARGTRNYCMLTGRGAEKADVLIDALAPFDGSSDEITPAHLADLRKAMRDVCHDIDDYTLKKIIEGDSPFRMSQKLSPVSSQDEDGEDLAKPTAFQSVCTWFGWFWPSFWQRAVLPSMAVGFLVFAMHYTHWNFNANVLLKRLDDHLATDVYEEIRDLIVVASAIDTASIDASTPFASTPSQKLFSQTMNDLKNYHFQEASLRGNSTTAVDNFNPVVAFRKFLIAIPDTIKGNIADQAVHATNGTGNITATEENQHSELAELKFGDDVADNMNVIDAETVSEIAGGIRVDETKIAGIQIASGIYALIQGRSEPVIVAIAKDDWFQEIVQIISQRTFRHPDIPEDYIGTRSSLLQTKRELSEKISIANRFALPMIYGSLGAVLFCLVRVLTPALSDLGPARAFLRILFGAFAAMTLSMLFIPANVFTINYQSNPTLIFLACFLFGYSFGAVLSALDKIEAFFHERLQPKGSG